MAPSLIFLPQMFPGPPILTGQRASNPRRAHIKIPCSLVCPSLNETRANVQVPSLRIQHAQDVTAPVDAHFPRLRLSLLTAALFLPGSLAHISHSASSTGGSGPSGALTDPTTLVRVLLGRIFIFLERRWADSDKAFRAHSCPLNSIISACEDISWEKSWHL